MNFELVRSNIDYCEKLLQSGNHKEAMRVAYEVAKLIINYAGKIVDINKYEDLVDRNIALLSIAGEIQSQLSDVSSCLSGQTVSEEIRKRTKDVLGAFKDTESEISVIIETNKKLLSAEDALKNKKNELEETKEKVSELLTLKNNKIEEINNEIESIKKEISKKEEEINQAKQELEELKDELQSYIINDKRISEIKENILTIKLLPDSTRFESVDKLIDNLKQRLNNIPDDTAVHEVMAEINNIYTSLDRQDNQQ